MVIARITGGLGNQLFQYALGRRLALERGTRLYLDISGFRTYQRHRYGLCHFTIAGTEAGSLTMLKLKVGQWLRRRPWLVMAETDQRFDPGALATPLPVYLAGYWQSERYFPPTAILRQDLTLKTAPGMLYQRWLERIRSTPAVSLHVRRTNYLTMGAKLFTVCTPAYYRQAVAAISQRVKLVTVFVFSDDIAWAKANLALPTPVEFVSAPDLADHEELMLMAACRHHITANSTFGWWGAWLNPRPDKIVVTPRQWFSDPARSQVDLVPENWIKL